MYILDEKTLVNEVNSPQGFVEEKRKSRRRAWHERATQGVRGRSWGHGQPRGLGRQFGSGCSDGKGSSSVGLRVGDARC